VTYRVKVLGRNVVGVSKAYLTKITNWIGKIVWTFGGRKTIKSGGLTFDRDINGASGILLKALVDHPVSVYRYCNCYRKVA